MGNKVQKSRHVPAPTKGRANHIAAAVRDDSGRSPLSATNPEAGQWSAQNVMQLQRTIGNHAVMQLFSKVIQRNGEEDAEPESGMLQQVQIQALPEVPDYRREVYALERNAIEAANETAILREEVQTSEDWKELADLNARHAGMMAKLKLAFQRALDISKVLPAEQQAELNRPLQTIKEIQNTIEPASIAFRRELGSRMYGDELEQLSLPSSPTERSRVEGLRRDRHPAANEADRKEINNWVSGSASMMNKMLFGKLTGEDRALKEFILQSGDDRSKWGWNLEARSAGLKQAMDKIPKFHGTTYRKARAANANVFHTLIHPGDYVMSKGFFATSMLKGAEGAGGGQESWGKGDNVYFQVTGVTGTDLGPYQDALQGEREVLYPAESVFEVKAIKHKGDTALVILSQVLLIPEDAEVKDPYSGKLIGEADNLT